MNLSLRRSALARRIAQRGFRRWYERQLIDAHIWLVACFVAMVIVAAGLELSSQQSGWVDKLYDATLVVGGIAGSIYGFRRYSAALMVAEFVAGQAECSGCGRYGFRVNREAVALPGEVAALCPQCAHRWAVRLPGVESERH
jgi:Mn2+/Fe2+ NRAMP family transporter